MKTSILLNKKASLHSCIVYSQTFEELYEYAGKQNKFAFINDVDTMGNTFGTSCQFIAMEKLLIDDSKWAIYSHKYSHYISILDYQ